MSNVMEKIKERHFVTLTRIGSTKINQNVFLYCTLLTILLFCLSLQQRIQYGDHRARCAHCTCGSCSGTITPLHLVSVDSLVQFPELVRVDLPLSPQGSDTPEISCGPTKNRVALNSTTVEAMQSGHIGLSIFVRDIG